MIGLSLVLSALLATPVPGAETRFVVVVNAANPETSADAETLTAIFLRQRKKWRNEEPIVPVDQSVTSPVRSAFTAAVFGQPASTIQAYWEAEVGQGHDRPPTVRAGDAEVLRFVAANAGAIGYVAPTTPLPPAVKPFRLLR
jgi:ABC-type phosphate transport system substrate-binding protein